MAVKDFSSGMAFLALLLVLFVGVPPHVSALSDINFMETGGHVRQDVSSVREKNLLKVLGLLVNGPGKRPLDGLAEETSPPSIANLLTSEEANDLTTLLDKLFTPSSFRSQEQTGTLPSSRQKGDDEVFHVMASKRAREHLSGAMPPLNELCRLMNVQCY